MITIDVIAVLSIVFRMPIAAVAALLIVRPLAYSGLKASLNMGSIDVTTAALVELLCSEILELLRDRRRHEVLVGTAELSVRSRSRSHSRDRSHPRYSPQ